MNFFELIERFVVAQEKQAKAAMMMAVAAHKEAVPNAVFENGGGVGGPSAEVVQATERPTSGTALPDWNPLAEPIQGRYGKDKITILDRCLAAAGVSVKASATGAEKHQALLDVAGAVAAEEAIDAPTTPAEDTPPPPPAKADKPAEKYPTPTGDDVRKLAQKALGAGVPAAEVQDVFEQHGGSRRLPEIPEDKVSAVYRALLARVELGV